MQIIDKLDAIIHEPQGSGKAGPFKRLPYKKAIIRIIFSDKYIRVKLFWLFHRSSFDAVVLSLLSSGHNKGNPAFRAGFIRNRFGTTLNQMRQEWTSPVSLLRGPAFKEWKLESHWERKPQWTNKRSFVAVAPCRTIESYTKEAIEGGFPDALKKGQLEFKVLNVEEPQNEHFVQDYQLSASSVVLARFKRGKQEDWKNLQLVWELVRDHDAFVIYVQEEAKSFLGQGR